MKYLLVFFGILVSALLSVYAIAIIAVFMHNYRQERQMYGYGPLKAIFQVLGQLFSF